MNDSLLFKIVDKRAKREKILELNCMLYGVEYIFDYMVCVYNNNSKVKPSSTFLEVAYPNNKLSIAISESGESRNKPAARHLICGKYSKVTVQC